MAGIVSRVMAEISSKFIFLDITYTRSCFTKSLVFLRLVIFIFGCIALNQVRASFVFELVQFVKSIFVEDGFQKLFWVGLGSEIRRLHLILIRH